MAKLVPTPIHGWRVFAGEVGIIVLGVLIALGAQQLLEEWSWRQRAADGLQALRPELANAYVGSLELVETQPCIDAQLVSLASQLNAAPRRVARLHREDGMSDYVFRAPTRIWNETKWQAMISEGVTSHFASRRRDELAHHYGQVELMRENNARVAELEWQLGVLALPLAVDGQAIVDLNRDIAEARGRFGFMKLVGEQIIDRLDRAGMQPNRATIAERRETSGTYAFCRAKGLPIGRFVGS